MSSNGEQAWLRWAVRVLVVALVSGVMIWGGYVFASVSSNSDEIRAVERDHGETLARHETDIQVLKIGIEYQTKGIERLEKKFGTLPEAKK